MWVGRELVCDSSLSEWVPGRSDTREVVTGLQWDDAVCIQMKEAISF